MAVGGPLRPSGGPSRGPPVGPSRGLKGPCSGRPEGPWTGHPKGAKNPLSYQRDEASKDPSHKSLDIGPLVQLVSANYKQNNIFRICKGSRKM